MMHFNPVFLFQYTYIYNHIIINIMKVMNQSEVKSDLIRCWSDIYQIMDNNQSITHTLNILLNIINFYDLLNV